MAGALRTALAATIAAWILLVLQAGQIAPGLYLIFLVSYDVSYLTLKHGLQNLIWQSIGVGITLLLIQITNNDPMMRVLGIAGFTFLSAFLLCACTQRVAAMNLGIFPVLTFTLWERHLPAEQLVHLSIWVIGTGALSVGCKVLIEYFFTRRDPCQALEKEMRMRLESVEKFLTLSAQKAPAEEMRIAVRTVSRYAFAGQSRMLSLLEETRNEPQANNGALRLSPHLIPHIARLLDLTASYARQRTAELSPAEIASLYRSVKRVQSVLRNEPWTDAEEIEEESPSETPLLRQMEQTLFNIAMICRLPAEQHEEPEPLAKLTQSRKRVPLFLPDAWTNPAYRTYAFKLSLCATLCYILYNALAWPGISTATLTVLIAGLSSSGASNQKMFFRLLGALLGGVFLGLGCIVFVYPVANTALPFLLSVAAVSLLAAWMARSAHFGYVGLQIAFSFYLVAFQESMSPIFTQDAQGKIIRVLHGFGAPMGLTQGRDRVLGILLALVVMWAIFHRLHPERTVDRMRLGLARLLRTEANQFEQLIDGNGAQMIALRAQAEQIALEVRTLAESIPYEMDAQLEEDLRQSEQIEAAIGNAGNLLLHMVTAGAEAHAAAERIARELRAWADGLEGKSVLAKAETCSQNAPALPASICHSHAQLHSLCRMLASYAVLQVASEVPSK
jgi:multidrug resistance protein MdtO